MKNFVGRRFGRLTVKEYRGVGNTKSCGCLVKEHARQMGLRSRGKKASEETRRRISEHHPKKGTGATPEDISQYQLLMRLAFPENTKAIQDRSHAKHRTVRNERSRKRSKEHPEVWKAWQKNNPDKLRATAKRFRDTHREERRKYHRQYCFNRIQSDPGYKILCRLRSSLSEHLTGRIKSKRTLELLGCSMEDFQIYLSSKFETGMSWDNYGRTGWHIDHIIPCALFDLTRPEHQKVCFHFSNMQPLWWEDNIRKGATLTTSQFNLI